MLTVDDLKRIEEEMYAAPEAPWNVVPSSLCAEVSNATGILLRIGHHAHFWSKEERMALLQFTANAPQHIRLLIGEVKRLQEVLENTQTLLTASETECIAWREHANTLYGAAESLLDDAIGVEDVCKPLAYVISDRVRLDLWDAISTMQGERP